jgi:Mg2+/Co2+ transporter CorB
VNLFVKGLLKLLRLTPGGTLQTAALSPEELRTLVLEGGHFLPAKHQKILLNLFDLQSITVDDLMTPRNQIEVVNIDADALELERQIKTSNHTRLPVYRGSLDNIIGLLHARKVLNLGTGEARAESLMQIMRPPYFIPLGTPLLAQLQNFQEEEERLGLVVDEYGELMGLITLEDILEEIIGEFTTQSPLQSRGINRQTDGSVLVEGAITLRELNRKLGIHFPLDGPKTINGLILEHLEDIPEPGTTVKIAGHPIEIVQTQDRAVRSARIFPA